jgi:cyclin-dependent kinase 14
MLREAALLRTLRHANVVTLHDIIITGSAIYFVLELCSCNLRQHFHELKDRGLQTMEPRSLCLTATHIFSALACIHELQIMHRYEKSKYCKGDIKNFVSSHDHCVNTSLIESAGT